MRALPLFVIVLLFNFIVTGCKKATRDPVPAVPAASTTPAPVQNQAADDNSQADFIFNDVNNIIDDAARSEGGVNKMTGVYCYTATKDSTSSTGYPQTITIDFGTGCKSPDGKTRKGKIVFVVTQKRTTLNALDSVRFIGFSIDQFKIDGAITNRVDSVISIQGASVPVRWIFKVTGANNTKEASITDTVTKKSHSWYTNKTRIVYFAPPAPIYWFYSGISGGTNINNETYISNVDHSIKVIDCAGLGYTAVSGSFKLTIIDASTSAVKSSLAIDYGDGTCDKLATAIINGGSPVTVSFK